MRSYSAMQSAMPTVQEYLDSLVYRISCDFENYGEDVMDSDVFGVCLAIQEAQQTLTEAYDNFMEYYKSGTYEKEVPASKKYK